LRRFVVMASLILLFAINIWQARLFTSPSDAAIGGGGEIYYVFSQSTRDIRHQLSRGQPLFKSPCLIGFTLFFNRLILLCAAYPIFSKPLWRPTAALGSKSVGGRYAARHRSNPVEQPFTYQSIGIFGVHCWRVRPA